MWAKCWPANFTFFEGCLGKRGALSYPQVWRVKSHGSHRSLESDQRSSKPERRPKIPQRVTEVRRAFACSRGVLNFESPINGSPEFSRNPRVEMLFVSDWPSTKARL